MNKTQLVKKLAEFNLTGEVSGAGKSLEVELPNVTQMRKFRKNIAKWGGYSTQYGAWVLQASYVDDGDWNDKSSICHY